MFHEIMRLVGEVKNKPELIMAENVPGLKKYLGVMQEEYEKAGYKLKKVLYNSKHWGVAQNRERYYVAGVRQDIEKEFIFPVQGTEITVTLMDILEDDADEKLFIDTESHPLFLKPGDTFEIETENEDGEIVIETRTAELTEELANKRIEKDIEKDEYIFIKQATKLGYDIAFVGDGVNLSHPKSTTRRGRVGKGICQTLLTSPEQVVILPGGKARYFTTREIARLQGFPDHFETTVSDSQFVKQLGNAVSVPVARAIAEKMIEFLDDVKEETIVNDLKEKLISVGMKKGFSHPETVALSQELDKHILKKMKGQL
jgi:DNA (cytosine-5)-methyltransferase 1